MDGLQRIKDSDAVNRLKERDPQLFSADVDMRQAVMQRLGWTDLATAATGRLPLLENLAKALVDEGATDIVLLGMGGSSLAALTISRIIGSKPGMPRLHVMDTTSPIAVQALLDTLDPIRSFFLVSSKSGTTIEPLSLYAIFRGWMEQTLERPAAGKHFIAITDSGTPLEKMRQKEVMRVALSAPATVGGRFSALTMFGLTPAALIGVDLASMIPVAQTMEMACHAPAEGNPGALLAAFMYDALEDGRDKLTVVTSREYETFGLWIEQLVAESTGKHGQGIVPVIEYAPTTPLAYDNDRMIVVLRKPDDHNLVNWATHASAAHPLLEFIVEEPEHIGAEFVRWEYAVALVGHLMDINPFDEPNVAEAKETTMKVLDGSAVVPPAIADLNGTWVSYAGGLSEQPAPSSLVSSLTPLVQALQAGDYAAILAYVPDDEALVAPLREAASALASRTQKAVCLEIGPRYLHSTGQLHKGGANKGVYLVITARDRVDVEIPGRDDLTLAQLFRAQAEGDLTTLANHDRRAMRLDLPSTTIEGIAAIAEAIKQAASEG